MNSRRRGANSTYWPYIVPLAFAVCAETLTLQYHLRIKPNLTCKTEKVAYTATTLEPEIVICKYPSRSEVARLKNTSKGTKVEYVSLAFTRDGKRLVSCGGLPNFEVLLWDVEKQTLIASASVKNDCSMCAFNPLDNNQFYVGGEHGLWFFSLRQEYDEFILDKVHAQLSDIAAEEENEDEESLEEEEQMSDYITAASWTTDQILLVANAMGEFMQVSSGVVATSRTHASAYPYLCAYLSACSLSI